MGLNRVSPIQEHNLVSEFPTEIKMGLPISSRLRRLAVLIWKNTVLVRTRHWIIAILEILVPLALFSLMASIRANSADFGSTVVKDYNYYEPHNQLEFNNKLKDKTIHYAPTNNFTRELMSRVYNFSSPYSFMEGRGHGSELQLLIYYSSLENDSMKSGSFAAVVFEEEAASPNFNKIPKKLTYKLRFRDNFKTDSIFDDSLLGPVKYITPYENSGFLGLQFSINKAFIEMARGHENNEPPSLLQDQFFLQRMPYPPYTDDKGYNEVIKTMLPIISTMSFVILCVTVVKRVVEEKQSGAKELMKLMGMEDWTFWLSWMIDAVIIRAISVAFIVWLLTMPFNTAVGSVLKQTSPTLLFFVLMVYCISAITFLFAISTLFQRPVVAMISSMLAWFITLALPYYYVEHKSPGFYTKMLTIIFPNMGLYFTFNAVLDLEKRGVGGQWNNIHESGSGLSRDLSLLNVLFMFVFDIILYSAITWYISKVNPGEYGYKQPYNFFLSKSYWFGEDQKQTTIEDPEDTNVENFERPLAQSPESMKEVGIVIRNLKKTYPGHLGRPPVKAVQGVSLDIYKGDITALLGHNGAGKTTTMSILTGMISPSSGAVNILGSDLKNDLITIRQSLGLCPQHNLLFGELTVHQHLIFFAMLKGSRYRAAQIEADELLSTVHLNNKRDSYACELSGGMKRKLSLAIALIGGSKVIMLDEPTSGLDPEARRDIWDLLLNLRKERTILLSTHFMEEADVLGDTIAIMSHGKVECCGSTMYLKRLYGAGYHLNLLRSNNCDVEKVVNMVKQMLPEAVVEHSLQDEVDNPNSACAGPVSFTLPANKVEQFPELFEALERSKADLGVASIGVSVTTMEEVFLRVGALTEARYAEEKNGDFFDEIDLPQPEHANGNGTVAHSSVKNLGWELFLERVQGLLEKKMIFSKRQWLYIILQFALPVLSTLGAVWASNAAISVDVSSEPNMLLSLEQYGSMGNLQTVYSVGTGFSSSFAKDYASYVRSQSEPVQISGNTFAKLIDIGKQSLAAYRSNYIVGAQFNETGDNLYISGLFGIDAIHAASISLDLVSNTLLKNRASSAYQIMTYNHPLPVDSPIDHINVHNAIASAISFIWLTVAHVGWMFATAVTLVLPLQERVLGSRQLQLMAGCPLPMIWLSYLLIDVLIITVVSIAVLAVIFPLDSLHLFTSGSELGVLFLVFFLYGISGTSFAYFVSFVKDNVPSAFGFIIFLGIFGGGIVNLIVYALELFPHWADIGSALRTISGLLLPHSALISSLSHFSGIAVYNSVCKNIPPLVKEFTCSQESHAFIYPAFMCCEKLCKKFGRCFEPLPYLAMKREGDKLESVAVHGPIGREILFFVVGTFGWLLLVLLLDSGVLSRATEYVLSFVNQKLHPDIADDDEVDGDDDNDVDKESRAISDYVKRNTNVESDGSRGPILAVDKLKKQYGVPLRKCRFPAVQGVSFRVRQGECFGLLGVNGAGKSTTFKMLTGAAPPTGGNAVLGSMHLQGKRSEFLSGLGYCPQTDAQLGLLTGRETLQLYARLRGVKNINQEVNKWLEALGLKEYAERPSGTYSGGNQRKLSAAMALIGEPPVALLDEPTSGVDPIARRQLWQALAACQKAGQSIVLTSHSMDECEALCSRLAIMVGGRMVCVGPIGHLKNKYGQGYTLMVKVTSESWNNQPDSWLEAGKKLTCLKDDIDKKLQQCKLLDEHQGLLHYQIKSTQTWSTLFKNMELLKKDHDILEDYTLSETTLEQVFLSFAQQKDQVAR